MFPCVDAGDFMRQVRAYADEAGISPQVVFRRAVNGGSAYRRVVDSGQVTLPTLARITGWMQKHPPETQRRTRRVGARTPTYPQDRSAFDPRLDTKRENEIRLSTADLAAACGSLRPQEAPARKLSFEEKLALVQSGRAKLVSSAIPVRTYDYTLAGVSW